LYIQQVCVHARNPWRDLYLNSYTNFIKLIKLHSRFSFPCLIIVI
jgi:hypothetical protein